MFSLYLLMAIALISQVASNSSEDGSLDKTGVKTTNCTCGWRGQVEDKIVGGKIAGEGEFPSQIRLYEYSETLQARCGGTIVTEKYSLVAIQCLRSDGNWTDKSLLRVCYGKADTTGLDESDTLKVEKYIPYDVNYNDFKFGQSDIALLKVQEKFEFGPNVGPACFPTVEEPMIKYDDEDVLATGYGYTEWDSKRRPVKTDLLHKVHLIREWDESRCNNIIGLDVFNSEDVRICTLTPGKSICRGDIGGPLYFYDKEMERYVLIGVASVITAPPNGCTPVGGFMSVGKFRKWILKVLSEEGEALCMKQ